jgi:ABC-type dipeptide/oligopeptide/nickel transport system permease component
MGMGRYVFFRILGMIAVVWFIGTITFGLMHAIPGGPWDEEKPLTEEAKANIRRMYGLDKPLITQYLLYWRNFLRFDFGHPYQSPVETVQGLIGRTWPASVQLGLMTIVVAAILGIGLGILGALYQNTWVDYLTTLLAIFGVVTPNFALGMALILLFSTILGWLPAGGWDGPKYYIMPVICFALGPMATLARYTRTSMIDVMREDYVRTARAKGLPESRVVVRHMLRNALIPIMTILGPMAGALVTGSIYVEAIFRVPGIGRYFTSSITARDFPMMMGITMLYAVIVAVSYLLTDLSYMFVDPRVKLA